MEGFQFKKFAVRHDRSAQKVGTDAVLLGSWADVEGDDFLLDAGTGCGLIALMLAQRVEHESRIAAIDIDDGSLKDATENKQQNPFGSKVEVYKVDIADYRPQKKLDHIVSNPPFFRESLAAPNRERDTARHDRSNFLENLQKLFIEGSSEDAKLSVILPETEGIAFIHSNKDHGLFLSRKLNVRSRKGMKVERLLLEFRKQETELEEEELILYTDDANRVRSIKYQQLCGDFYL